MTPPEDFDKPWKIALENFFPEFMHFFFPDAARQIDWDRGHEFLDKELQKVVREAESGGAHVDKLVKVVLNSGEEEWVCIHVEVQAQPEESFPGRMFRYNYRIYDRYQRSVASLAILADEDPEWRPGSFGYGLFGCQVEMSFPTVKLLEYNDWIEGLLESDNPFALVTAAHLLTQQTRGDSSSRFDAKWELTKMLYRRGWTQERIVQLFRVIDWLLYLPKPLEDKLMTNRIEHEEEIGTDEMCPYEQLLYEKAYNQAAQEAELEAEAKLIRRQLQKRFGDLPKWVDERLESAEIDELEQWAENFVDADTLEDVFEQ